MVFRLSTNHKIPEFGSSYIVWSFYFTSVNLIFLFLLIPEKRLSYSMRLPSISESEKTQISLQRFWNLGPVKFDIIQSLFHTEISNSTEAGNCFCRENVGKHSCWHALHTSSSGIPVSCNFNSQSPREGEQLGFTAGCGLCLICWHWWWWPDTQFGKLSGLCTSWPQESLN